MEIPFWEESYKDDGAFAFGTQPNATIVEFENNFGFSWRILDVGCGDGKNSLYLSRRGFSCVEAFDLSAKAIAKLHRIAEKENLTIRAWEQDLCTFSFADRMYDLVFSFGTLHFAEKTDWKRMLHEAKEHTVFGGMHIIQLFTNVLPASPDIAPFAVGLADDGEIRDVYEDWDILQYKSYTFEDEHPGVPRHTHASNKIVARRKQP